MTEVRNVVSLALEQRAAAKIPVRQPLGRLALVSGGGEFSEALLELIRDEVNVKDIARIAGLPEGFVVELDTTITPELKEEGMVREMQRAIQVFRKEKEMRPNAAIGNIVLFVPEEYVPVAEKNKSELAAFGTIDGIQIRVSAKSEIALQYDEQP
jgi:hypothetical protein